MQRHRPPRNLSRLLRQRLLAPFLHLARVVHPAPARVHLDIFDSLGRRVRTLIAADKQPGLHTYVWNGRDDQDRSVGSGVYFYRLETNGHKRLIRSMVFLK